MKRIVCAGFLLSLLMLLCMGAAYILSANDSLASTAVSTYVGADWYQAYRPAVNTFLRGKNPYGANFYNPPWALLFIAPITILTPPWDFGLLLFVHFVVFGIIGIKFGLSPFSFVLALLSYPVLAGMFAGQIEWLPLLGLIMPPWLGVLFLMIKPQVGIGVLVYWAIVRFHNDGIIGVCKLFALGAVCLTISLLLYGFWPGNMVGLVEREGTGLWPYIAVLGVYLLYRAVARSSQNSALLAGPCLSPHVWGYLLTCGVFSVSYSPIMAAFIFCLSWLLIIHGS